MEMVWAQLDFLPGNIYNFIISDKKNEFQKFCPHGFLRFYQLVWTLIPTVINFE